MESHVFTIPTKKLTTPEHLEQFQVSECKQNILNFILSLQQSVLNCRRSSAPPCPNANPVVSLLERISIWVDETPPITQPQRYGNKAFTTLQHRINSEGLSLVAELLRTKPEGESLLVQHADEELTTYLCNSFGDPIRIDYGHNPNRRTGETSGFLHITVGFAF